MDFAPIRETTRLRRGITLLEVLISCGLLIVGLSTIAALLPAAGSRMTQATNEDRAAVLLSNAVAEIVNRGLLATESFPTEGAGSVLAFGKVLERLPAFGNLPSGYPASDFFSGLSAAAQRRCGSWRTFVLEDLLAYVPSAYSDNPINSFTSDGAGLGPRAFRKGLCWGATLAPRTRPVAPGGKADLAIVVFKRWEEAMGSSGEGAVALSLKRDGSFYEAELLTEDEDSLLRGCSWLLAIPAAATDAPRWFRIMSSWNSQTHAGRTRRVVLRDQTAFEALTNTSAAGATATVFAFDGIVRVDEQAVTLD